MVIGEVFYFSRLPGISLRGGRLVEKLKRQGYSVLTSCDDSTGDIVSILVLGDGKVIDRLKDIPME